MDHNRVMLALGALKSGYVICGHLMDAVADHARPVDDQFNLIAGVTRRAVIRAKTKALISHDRILDRRWL